MNSEMVKVLNGVIAGEFSPDGAVRKLKAHRAVDGEAEEFAMGALGGSDVVDIDADGRKYFITGAGRVPVGRNGWPALGKKEEHPISNTQHRMSKLGRMTDKELVKDFTKAVRGKDGVRIRVCRIIWPGPSRAESRWHTVEILPADAGRSVIAEARRNLLENKRYFAVCKECGERNPVGWMDSKSICQSCAERNHGVVY